MWSTFISSSWSAPSTYGRAVASEIRLPSRKARFSTSRTGSARRAASTATRSNPNPPTTVMSSAPAARANATACASNGRSPTATSAFGICSVSVPSRLPRPAASSTAFTKNLLEQRRQRREAANHRHRRKAQREPIGRERRRDADERNAFTLGDLAVVQRIAHEQHLLAGGAELARRGVQVRPPLGQSVAVAEHQIELEAGVAREGADVLDAVVGRHGDA